MVAERWKALGFRETPEPWLVAHLDAGNPMPHRKHASITIWTAEGVEQALLTMAAETQRVLWGTRRYLSRTAVQLLLAARPAEAIRRLARAEQEARDPH